MYSVLHTPRLHIFGIMEKMKNHSHMKTRTKYIISIFFHLMYTDSRIYEREKIRDRMKIIYNSQHVQTTPI